MALAAWGAELLIITLRDLGVNPPGLTWSGGANRISGLPAPGDYLATFVIFAPLAVLSGNSSTHLFAEAVGWGYVIATLLGALNGSNPLQIGNSQTTSATNQATGSITAAGRG
jgi:hypothetical protein